MKNKSLSINAVLYVIRNIMKILFPLITFPYISRVLGVDNIGNYNFASSVVNYFILIAELGISTYAVREGARLRGNKEKIGIFINEMFTINILSTLVSYLLLIFTLVFFKNIRTSALLITILASKIVFNTIGVEWVYTIYEDFMYIVARSITVQFLSLLLMFVFVRSSDDLYIYAGITVIASVGSNIFNWLHSRRYCRAKIIWKFDYRKHMAPILMIFATTISISIYSTSDMTILGIISGERSTGLYAVSAKVYDIAKSTLAAVILVSIPRLSAILGEKDFSQFEITAQRIYKTLISLAVPAMFGIMLLAQDIVLLISGEEYIDATRSLRILSIAAIMNLGAWFYGQCVLIPLKKEKIMLFMSIFTALLNIILNLFMIPVWAENAAAATTLISESVSFAIVMISSRKHVKFKGLYLSYVKTILGCIGMTMGVKYVLSLGLNLYFEAIVTILVGGVLYVIIEIILRNKEFVDIIRSFLSRIMRIKRLRI